MPVSAFSNVLVGKCYVEGQWKVLFWEFLAQETNAALLSVENSDCKI